MSGMTETEAIEIAKACVTATMGKELKLIGANDKTKKRRNLSQGSSEWNVLFESMLPDGTVIEGATIVIVDEATKQARLFEGNL